MSFSCSAREAVCVRESPPQWPPSSNAIGSSAVGGESSYSICFVGCNSDSREKRREEEPPSKLVQLTSEPRLLHEVALGSSNPTFSGISRARAAFFKGRFKGTA